MLRNKGIKTKLPAGLFSLFLMINLVVFLPVFNASPEISAPDQDADQETGTEIESTQSRSHFGWSKIFGDLQNRGNTDDFGPVTNKTLWKFATNGDVYSSPVIADGRLFIGSWDKQFYALDAESGMKLWNYSTGDFIYSSPAYHNGIVYIGTGIETGKSVRSLFALNAVSGKLVWKHQFPDNIYGTPVIYNNELLVGCGDGYLYALDPTGFGDGTTSIKWKFQTGADIWSTPAVYNNSVYITSNDCKLYRINLTTHNEVWNFSAEYYFEGIYGSPTIDSDGRVFFGSAVQPNGSFYAVDADTGALLWKFKTGISRYGVCATGAVNNGVIYVGSNNGRMYALKTSSGQELWNYSTGDDYNGIYSSAAIAGGYVYFGSTDGKMYCLKESSGEAVWILPTGGGPYGVVSSPAVLNGRLYFGGNDWYVYAVGLPRTGEIEIDAEITPDILEPGENATVKIRTFNGSIPLSLVELSLTAPSGSLKSKSSRSGVDERGTNGHSTRSNSRTSLLIGYSDSKGEYECSYTAPEVDTFTNIVIEIEASGDGLVTNSTTLGVIVNPHKQMTVKMTPTKPSFFIGESISVLMNITAGGEPVESALIKYTITYPGGDKTDFGFADFMGRFLLTYEAPSVTAETSVLIETTVEKHGYITEEYSITVTVLPKSAYNFDIIIVIDPEHIIQGEKGEVKVKVVNKTNDEPVKGVNLLLSINDGTLAETDGTTDANGEYKTSLTAPDNIDSDKTIQLKVKGSRTDFNDLTVSKNITITKEASAQPPGGGDSKEEEKGFFQSSMFYVSIMALIIVLIVAAAVIMQAKKKREKMEKESKEDRVEKAEKTKSEEPKPLKEQKK